MENNNIGDFFRKRLKGDMSNEDWANPGLEIDNKVLSQISEPDEPASRGWGGIIFKSSIGILLFLLSSSLIYLNHELSIAKNELINLNKIAEKTKTQSNIQNDSNKKSLNIKDVITTKLKAENEQLKLEKEKHKKQNGRLIQQLNKQSKNTDKKEVVKFNRDGNVIITLKEEKEMLASENQRLNQINQQLINEKTVLRSQLNVQKESLVKIVKNSKVLKDSLILLTSVIEGNMKSLIDNKPIEEQLNLKKKSEQESEDYEKFRVGYEYSSERFRFPTSITFNNHSLVSGSTTISFFQPLIHGLNFSFSPKKGWWLKAGLRYGKSNLVSIHKFGLAYSATNETLDPINGSISYGLNLENLNPFLRSNHSVTILFDQGLEPEEGSLLQYEALSNLKVSLWQLPVGLERQFTVGRTNLFFQGGAQLNLINIEDFSFDSYILDSNELPLNVVAESLEGQDLNNRLNLNLFGEVGIEQGIFREWYLTAALNYSYKFLNNNGSSISNETKISNAIRLGVSHRF